MSASQNQVGAEWFRRSFDDLYPSLYGHRGIVEASDLLARLNRFLPLTEGRVLDLGCGPGRYLRALVDLGGNPIGADLSLPMLLRARQTSSDVPLVRADMRALPFRSGSFGVVLLMFTTFGYFLSDAEDLKVLCDIASILEPTGRFVLDYINAGHLRDHLVPTSERQIGPLTVEERRWIDTGGKFLHKESRVTEAGSEEVRVYRERLRLYDPAEIEAMFGAVRLRMLRTFGDYEGRPFDRSASARLLVIAGRERGIG